ncbi:MAG: hypothetical protein ACR2O6_04840 [Ilumatobacteraceae bacterium]
MPARRPSRIGCAAAVVVAVVLAACDEGGAGDAERFCGEIDENKALLTAPDLAYTEDVEPLLELYREIADLAPLAIEEEWRQLVTTYETASTVVLGNEESEQAALAAAYRSEQAAVAVADWLRANCAVELGPLSTVLPQE